LNLIPINIPPDIAILINAFNNRFIGACAISIKKFKGGIAIFIGYQGWVPINGTAQINTYRAPRRIIIFGRVKYPCGIISPGYKFYHIILILSPLGTFFMLTTKTPLVPVVLLMLLKPSVKKISTDSTIFGSRFIR